MEALKDVEKAYTDLKLTYNNNVTFNLVGNLLGYVTKAFRDKDEKTEKSLYYMLENVQFEKLEVTNIVAILRLTAKDMAKSESWKEAKIRAKSELKKRNITLEVIRDL